MASRLNRRSTSLPAGAAERVAALADRSTIRAMAVGQGLHVAGRHQVAGDFRRLTSSGLPPTAVASTGRPVAIASRMVLEMPFGQRGQHEGIQPAHDIRHILALAGQPSEVRHPPGCAGWPSTSARKRPVAHHRQGAAPGTQRGMLLD